MQCSLHRLIATVAAVALCSGAAMAQTDAGFPAPAGDASVVAAGAKVEKLFEADCFSEGVSVGPDNSVYFSDITFTKFCKDPGGRHPMGGHIWRYDPRTGQATIFRSPSGMSNGTKFDRNGDMIIATGADYGLRVLAKIDMKTGRSLILAGGFEGKPFNALNDISIDAKGRIFFTDPRYLGHEPIMADGYAAYRLDPDGAVHRATTECGKCNGILVSPDQKRVYIVSNDNGFFAFENLKPGEKTLAGHHLLAVWDLAADGSLSNRRVFKDYSKDRTPACSGPDGLVADADGNLWVAERCEHRPGIAVYAPDGRELAFIPTGKELPTNVAFGRGDLANTLYITSGKSLYRVKVGKRGYELP
ncbi:MAG: SMP-30/gluconolactonase/LRE family protein [Burkholderiales bacterium]